MLYRRTFSLILLLTCIAGGLVAAHRVAAEEQEQQEDRTSLRLSDEGIVRGYTAKVPSENLLVAVWPNLVNQAVTIDLHTYPDPLPTPEGMTLVSDIWQFDILKADITVKDPILFSRPITLAIRHFSGNLYRKRIFFWDRINSVWRPLPSKRDFDRGYITAYFPLPYAQVAVFEDTGGVEGKASWLRWGEENAASNDYAYGSRLRVFDLDTGNFCDVTVKSTGPFVPGRVVDLSRTAFAKLRPTWQGVANVRVELLSSP